MYIKPICYKNYMTITLVFFHYELGHSTLHFGYLLLQRKIFLGKLQIIGIIGRHMKNWHLNNSYIRLFILTWQLNCSPSLIIIGRFHSTITYWYFRKQRNYLANYSLFEKMEVFHIMLFLYVSIYIQRLYEECKQNWQRGYQISL